MSILQRAFSMVRRRKPAGNTSCGPKSYPVGQVNLLDIFPMTFDEYLAAIDISLCSYYNDIRKDQGIEEIYENDFSRHNGKVNSGRILMVFRSIASQLAKPNEKFMYGAVREGGRTRDFEEAIDWLVSAGMLNRVYNVSKAEKTRKPAR